MTVDRDPDPAAVSALIEPEELAERIASGRAPRIVHTTLRHTVENGALRWLVTEDEFARGHIPGAVHADLRDAFSDPDSPYPLTRPSAERLVRALGALGIDRDTPVVAYDADGGRWAARLWWLLRAIGHPEARVLAGGWDRWIATGGEQQAGLVESVETDYAPAAFREDAFADIDRVRQLSAGEVPGVLVHALDRASFRGSAEKPRSGHIPGAVNLPWTEQFDPDGRVAPDPADHDQALAGLRAGHEVVAYCGSGISAAATLLALHERGYASLRLYDGSLTEWKAQPDTELAREVTA